MRRLLKDQQKYIAVFKDNIYRARVSKKWIICHEGEPDAFKNSNPFEWEGSWGRESLPGTLICLLSDEVFADVCPQQMHSVSRSLSLMYPSGRGGKQKPRQQSGVHSFLVSDHSPSFVTSCVSFFYKKRENPFWDDGYFSECVFQNISPNTKRRVQHLHSANPSLLCQNGGRLSPER